MALRRTRPWNPIVVTLVLVDLAILRGARVHAVSEVRHPLGLIARRRPQRVAVPGLRSRAGIRRVAGPGRDLRYFLSVSGIRASGLGSVSIDSSF